ncbi:MAG TPA: PH domain-containing protein, partial [Flavobacteriaceae bacterium]|nr:PH domain-containing protein [Flavobacteriaceae bacterium]
MLLIFFATLYKLVRGFWAIAAYLIFSSPSAKTWIYIGFGLAVVGILALVYSYVYYQKFLFHIDYKKEVFVLHKGVFSSENTEIPFDKIQQVNTEQSLLQRIANVYKLVIDTAGGKEKEASIMAISKAKANQLSAILMEAKETSETESEIGTENISAKKEKTVWSYKMSLATLLKIGISSNYFRGLAIILAFFSTIYQEFSRWFRDSVVLDEYTNQFSGLSKSISGILVLVTLFLLASIAITMIEVFIKYFNLKLQQTKSRLQVEMGLKTNKKVSLQPRRIQLLQTKTNPIQKKLDLHELKVSLANSEDALQKSKIRIPGLGKSTVDKVHSFLYKAEADGANVVFRSHKILLVRRLFFSLLPVAISWLIWWMVPFMNGYLLLALTGIYTAAICLYQFL